VGLPIGLERELRLLAEGITHPDAVVHYATTAGRYNAEVGLGDKKVAALLDLQMQQMQNFFERCCVCSVEVRPTNEYHTCRCEAGRVLRRFDRFMANITKKRATAQAIVTIG
jgi:hypothetical protein